MNWTRINPGSAQLHRLRAAAALDDYDPYLIWADLTKFAGYSSLPKDPDTGRKQVPIAAQFGPAYDPARYSGVFTAPVMRAGGGFCTGLVPVDKLVEFHDLLQPGDRFKMGLPAIAKRTKMNFDPVSRRIPLVVGIIDHGFAFANQTFRDPATGKTRVHWLWDQDRDRLKRNPGGHWRRVADVGYGGEIDASRIDALIRACPDEARLYRKVDYDPAYGRYSHGTHVMDIACGGPNPLRNAGNFSNADPTDARRKFEGPASTAPILAVQLPYRPAKDTSGGSLCVHVYDALCYIARRAKSADQIVVNLSDGAFAGPHDGSSMLESALDRFLLDNPKFTLVVAAGNAYEARCHAQRTIARNSSGKPLRWRVLPDDLTDSYQEIWLQGAAGATAAISVRPPGATTAKTVQMGEIWIGHEGGRPLCCVLGTMQSPNGPNRGTFFLALAPTRPGTTARAPAPHGMWEVTAHNNSPWRLSLDAHIERDNPALGDSGPSRQSYFVDDTTAAHAARKKTLNNVATGRETIAVGGHFARGRYFQEHGGSHRLTEVAPYSSSGPGHPGAGYDAPDVSAPSDESPALRGLRAAANRSGATVRLTGTSVAAPIVTRRIANMLVASSLLPPPVLMGHVKQRLISGHAHAGGNLETPREGAGRIKPGQEP